MRLSPGVGVEYLFTYKWLSLSLYFLSKYLDEDREKYLILLAVSVAFMFEGNMNIAISSVLLIMLYLIFNLKRVVNRIGGFILMSFLAFSIYSIKMLPFLDLSTKAGSRLEGSASGWRVSRIPLNEFIDYLLPKSHGFGNGMFTPGLVGLTVSITGLVLLILYRRKDKVSIFSITAFIVGILLVTDNYLSHAIFSLPFFNKLTISPAFLVFLTLPLSIFASNISPSKRYLKLLPYCLAVLVFVEVLLGYSLLGAESYSYNFRKMNKSEYKSFPHYNILKNLEPGVVYATEPYRFFLFPYGVQLNNLFFLNGYTYFYGSNLNEELTSYGDIVSNVTVKGEEREFKFPSLNSNELDSIMTKATYLLSTYPLSNDFLTLVSEVDYLTLDGMESDAVSKLMPDIRSQNLYGNWDGFLRVYKVAYFKNSVSAITGSPTSISFSVKEKNIVNQHVDTSITYSNWWTSSKENTLSKDAFGFLKITGPSVGEKVTLRYINPFIYIGFLLSLLSFCLVWKKLSSCATR